MTNKTTLLGAAFGLATFLAVGLLPAMLYGGYAGVLLASGIFGVPVPASFAVRAFIVGGMMFGTVGVAGLFTVVGASIGALAGVVLQATDKDPEAHPKNG
jgi:hypothetical protein